SALRPDIPCNRSRNRHLFGARSHLRVACYPVRHERRPLPSRDSNSADWRARGLFELRPPRRRRKARLAPACSEVPPALGGIAVSVIARCTRPRARGASVQSCRIVAVGTGGPAHRLGWGARLRPPDMIILYRQRPRLGINNGLVRIYYSFLGDALRRG